MRILLTVLTLLLALSACGDDDEIRSGGSGDRRGESSTVEEPTASDEPAAPPVDAEVCEVVTDADVDAAFAEDLPPGSFSSGSTDEDGVQWQSDNCNWEVEDGTEVSLELSTAEHFEGGELLCPELDSFDVPSTPVEGLAADSAAWVVDKIDPDEGTLRVCTDTYLLGIDIESPDGSRDEETMRSQTVAFAEVVLANLG